MKTRHKILCLLVGMLIGASVSGPDEQQLEQARYCEMVALHKADPSVGWPDFNESYDQECNHEQTASR